MRENLTQKTVKNSFWSIIDVLLRQGISFVISIVLTRLLTPSDYGTIGMMMIFIVISNVFVDSGFSSGLIRKIDRTENDLHTAFIFNIVIGVVVYSILFFCSPLIASFFNNPDLSLYLRVLGIILIINSFNLVQNAILIFSMKIRQLTLVSAIAQISTGIIAIFLAYQGWGVWALISQQIMSAFVNAILLAITTKYYPKLIFDRKSFHYLWNFGSKLLAANLIGSIFNQAYNFVVGKKFGKSDLGLYSRSQQFAQQPENIVNNIIVKALVPSLAECQNDLQRLQYNYQRCVEVIAFAIFPLMLCLAIVARPLFLVLFGQKWVDAIPLFSVLCLGYSVDIFSSLSLNLMQVMGRTDYTLKLEFVKKPIFVLIVFISIFYGLKGIAIGSAVGCLNAAIINMSVVKNLLHYSYWKQMVDLFKYVGITLLSLVPIYYIVNYVLNIMSIHGLINNIFQLTLIPIISSSFYLLLCMKTHIQAIQFIKEMRWKMKRKENRIQ